MQARQGLRAEPRYEVERPTGQDQRANAGRSGQEQAFLAHRAQQGTAATAQGAADSEFVTAGLEPDQEEVGDVGGGDHQDQAHRRHQHPEHGTDAADDALQARAQIGADAGVLEGLGGCLTGEGTDQVRGHQEQPRVGSLQRHAVRQPGDAALGEVAESPGDRFDHQRHSQPDFRRRKLEGLLEAVLRRRVGIRAHARGVRQAFGPR